MKTLYITLTIFLNIGTTCPDFCILEQMLDIHLLRVEVLQLHLTTKNKFLHKILVLAQDISNVLYT